MFFNRKPKKSEETPEPQLRKISQEELLQIISRHSEWLDKQNTGMDDSDELFADLSNSDLRGLNFEQADLRNARFLGSDMRAAHLEGCNLRWAGMAEVDLRGAYLPGAAMQDAHLLGACLENATLCGVDFTTAVANGAVFHGADLSGAILNEAKGLTAATLAGANLSGAKLPEYIDKFEVTDYVKGAVGHASKLFATLLVACLYCWITLGGLLVNDQVLKKVKLPVADVELPLNGFLFIAPMILLCLFVYMHLYLQNTWESIAGLPAILPDGTPMHKKVGSWLPLGYVRAFSPRLRADRGFMGWVQHLLTLFLLWMAVPVTLLMFLLISLNRGVGMVVLQGLAMLVVSFAAMYFNFSSAGVLSLNIMKKSSHAERFQTGGPGDFSQAILRLEQILFLSLYLLIMLALVVVLEILPRASGAG